MKNEPSNRVKVGFVKDIVPDVIQVVSGVRAFTLAFLARRAGLKVREVRV